MFHRLLLAVATLLVSSKVLGDQLPYPLQLFHLAPNGVSPLISYHPEPFKARMVPAAHRNEVHDEDEMKVEALASQFHAQDGKGRALFGYTSPDQARIESREHDGTVRGSYSYRDPWGQAVKVQYWDDGSGFHAAGNHLPAFYNLIPQPVQDTPEVQAAKLQHMQLYQQALAAALASAPPQPEQPVSTPVESSDTIPAQEEEGLVVESDPNVVADDSDSELTRYPNLDLLPQNLYDPTHKHDANREAVIVDNPDLSSNGLLRSAKNLGAPPLVPVVPEDGVSHVQSPTGFSYSFRYQVPMFVQVKTVTEGNEEDMKKNKNTEGHRELSVSERANLFGAIPVAAVHDAQVAPYQRDSIRNHQLLPVYVAPNQDS